jgi:hypothetical protein
LSQVQMMSPPSQIWFASPEVKVIQIMRLCVKN